MTCENLDLPLKEHVDIFPQKLANYRLQLEKKKKTVNNRKKKNIETVLYTISEFEIFFSS